MSISFVDFTFAFGNQMPFQWTLQLIEIFLSLVNINVNEIILNAYHSGMSHNIWQIPNQYLSMQIQN